MQFQATPIQLCKPGNTNHELAYNGSCLNIFSLVTRLKGVIPSSLGSIRSKEIPHNEYMKPSEPTVQWMKGKGTVKGKVYSGRGHK
jgi:hypothetical protein